MHLALLGLTPLGIVHTAISLVAVGAGLYALLRDKAIRPETTVGRVYVITTVLTCLTGFPIFQHGGFGAPHILGVITLLVLGVAEGARRTGLFGQFSVYVETICYSSTFFFHMIPGINETGTRLPRGAPLFSGPEDPLLQKVLGVVFLIYLVGVTWQVLRLRSSRAKTLLPQGVSN